MTDKELIQSLKQLKNSPSAGGVSHDFIEKNREIMMMQIRNSSAPMEKKLSAVYFWRLVENIMPENLFRFAVRPAVLSLLVFGVAFGSWAATVSASYNSLPGDTLYSLKMAAEKAQLTLTPGGNKVSLQTELAGRRLDEIAKIAEKPSLDNKKERTKKAVENFSQHVQAVKATLENIDPQKDGDKAVEMAQMVDRKTEEFATALDKAKEVLPAEVQPDMEKATSLINDASIKAIEVIVKQSEQGAVEINQDEVAGKIEEKIKIVEQSASQIATSTMTETVKADVQDAITEAKAALSDNNLGTVVDKLVEAKNLVNTVTADIATSTPSGSVSTTTPESGESE